MTHYDPTELEALCQSGELVWVGSGGVDPRRGRMRFLFRGEGNIYLEPAPDDLSGLSDQAQAVYNFLKSEGAASLTIFAPVWIWKPLPPKRPSSSWSWPDWSRMIVWRPSADRPGGQCGSGLSSFERRVTIKTWNGEPVLNSAGRFLLESTGAYRDYPGMTWEKGS